jgi:hypothetical protein
MGSIVVIQPRYETPIKLAFKKYSTAGTRGMDNVSWFKAKRDETVRLFYVACGRIGTAARRWRFLRGCSIPASAAR